MLVYPSAIVRLAPSHSNRPFSAFVVPLAFWAMATVAPGKTRVSPWLPPLPSFSEPALTAVMPEWVLLPVRVSVPAPVLLRPPEPLITEAISASAFTLKPAMPGLAGRASVPPVSL